MGRKLLYDEDSVNNIALAIQNKTGSSDKMTISQMAQKVMEITTGESDITWDRTLLDEWDFTKSLTSEHGRTFTIETGATRDSSGLLLESNQARVYCDINGLITNGYKTDIELDLDVSGFNRNDDAQLFAFFATTCFDCII